jgi:hypothetical protein
MTRARALDACNVTFPTLMNRTTPVNPSEPLPQIPSSLLLNVQRDARPSLHFAVRQLLTRNRMCVLILCMKEVHVLIWFAAPVGDPAQPDVIATAVFPADNQLGRMQTIFMSHCIVSDGLVAGITNGKSNKLQVGIENKSAQNITITSIGGSLHHPETGKLYKNV